MAVKILKIPTSDVAEDIKPKLKVPRYLAVNNVNINVIILLIILAIISKLEFFITLVAMFMYINFEIILLLKKTIQILDLII